MKPDIPLRTVNTAASTSTALLCDCSHRLCTEWESGLFQRHRQILWMVLLAHLRLWLMAFTQTTPLSCSVIKESQSFITQTDSVCLRHRRPCWWGAPGLGCISDWPFRAHKLAGWIKMIIPMVSGLSSCKCVVVLLNDGQDRYVVSAQWGNSHVASVGRIPE